jgi:SCP-2 sterol transfer family
VATKTKVEQKLRELINRLKRADGQVHSSLAESLPDPRIIQISIPDLDASYWTEMAGGVMGAMHKGEPPRADIRIRCTSDHLVEIVDGKRSLFGSYLSGQLKVEASFTDMLRLRRLA